MPEPGKGDNVVAEFTTLDLEGGSPETPQKLDAVIKYLEENLKPEKMAKVKELLGLKTDLSNAELLLEFKKLLQEYPAPEDEKKKKKKKEDEEEIEAADYPGFMKQCMKAGKSMVDCAKEYKKKYPAPEKEPKKEEIAEVEQLARELAKKKEEDEEEEKEEYPKPVKKKMEELENLVKTQADRITALEKQKELSSVESEVTALVAEKHLSPRQRTQILELSAKIDPAARDELFNFFRTTQKFNVSEDVGLQESKIPGSSDDYTAEQRKEIAEKQGLNRLIETKADKTRKGKWWGPN